mmetsp:Transcript_2464/g.3546  ORF Transcript_2464/g.3546 Transcript_2464/m.3546 type:complete len:98 (-) Transcript_2464:132-425(-)
MAEAKIDQKAKPKPTLFATSADESLTAFLTSSGDLTLRDRASDQVYFNVKLGNTIGKTAQRVEFSKEAPVLDIFTDRGLRPSYTFDLESKTVLANIK